MESRSNQHIKSAQFMERFETVDDKALLDSGEAMLSFWRERCIRGNARKFRIFLDDREVKRISLDGQCHVSCPAGFHKVYVKLDSLTSPVTNLKTEAGQRYYFDIACTMNEGMILQRIEEKQEEE